MEHLLSPYASGDELKKAAAFNEVLQSSFPFGRMLCVAKGIYRFKTHKEANFHEETYIAKTMARISAMNKSKSGGSNG